MLKKKKKPDLLRFFSSYRRVFAPFFVMLIVICFLSIDVFADSAVDFLPETPKEYFEIDDSTLPSGLDTDTMKSLYASAGFASSELNNRLSGFYSSSSFSSNVLGSVEGSYKICSEYVTSENVTYDFTNAYRILTYGYPLTYPDKKSISVMGSGTICICNYAGDNYVVSDQPFTIGGAVLYEGNTTWDVWTVVPVSETSSNGYYTYQLNYYDLVYITDLNIYAASPSGDSGFTTFTTSSTDFSFDAMNFNFNYLLTNNIIKDNMQNPATEDKSKYNLYFRDFTSYSGDGMNKFYHHNDFQFSDYQINNPSKFRIRFDYEIHYKDNLGSSEVFYCSPQSHIRLDTLLGQTKRLGGGNKVAIPLNSNNFLNTNSQSLSHRIIQTINSVTGESTEYINPNGLFENAIDFLVGVDSYTFGTGNFTYGFPSVLPRYDGVITEFYIIGRVTMYNSENPNYESKSYVDKYNFLTSETEVVSTENTEPSYQEDEQHPLTPTYQTPSGGGGVSTGGGNYTSNVTNVYNSMGNEVKLWTPYTMDQVDYGNMKTIADGVKDYMDTSADKNGFWAVLTTTTQYIPSDIWNWIKIGVGIITFAAIVKFVRNQR